MMSRSAWDETMIRARPAAPPGAGAAPAGRVGGGVAAGEDARPLGGDGEPDAVRPPQQLVVGPLQPLVRYDAVAEKQNPEDERGCDQGLAPRQRRTGRAAAADEEDQGDAGDEGEQRDEELETYLEAG